MKKITQTSISAAIVVLLLLSGNSMRAQSGGLGSNDKGFPVTTAVPFLRIAPDARSGGMGEVGIALQPDSINDPNGTFHNPAKVAFNTRPLGISVSYTPWLRQLVNDIYLAHLSAYYKIDKLQAVAMSLRYFSLGQITFTNVQGENTGQFRPNEFSIDGSYSRILAKGFSAGIGLRFIYSNLATGQTVNGVAISPGIAAAADIAFYYNKPIKLKKMKTNLAFGLNLSNIGSKISYTESAEKDFIPMNMGLGTAWQINIDDHNQITLAVDANKLMVPTPSTVDADSNGILDYREKSVPAGLFGSFGDAPNGFKEEMQEFIVQVGAEYWYDQLFAVRAGYFHEASNKGGRQFLTAGLGLRYSVFGLDFSYLIPTTSKRNPLDNTLRFTLVFTFAKLNKGKDEPPAPVDGTSTSSRMMDYFRRSL
ncbi:MAG: type IX secretion system outer membrane channel protein PorV [Chitinophagales bacterium]|nr:type IX secretion system outer membrane channel protein PorV [Chitinophagales bacterium]